jgi:hypothetical protein
MRGRVALSTALGVRTLVAVGTLTTALALGRVMMMPPALFAPFRAVMLPATVPAISLMEIVHAERVVGGVADVAGAARVAPRRCHR